MIGPAIIVFVLVVAFPIVFLMSMGAVAAILGTATKKDAEMRYEGSELLSLG